MNYSEVLGYVLTVILLVSTPGPVVTLVMNTTLRQGPLQGIKTILGTNMASLILIILAALVINQIFTINTLILSVLKIFGCLYILYLAYDNLRSLFVEVNSPLSLKLKRAQDPEKGFRTGFMVGISNPKDIIFFVSFFPQFITIAPSPNASLAVLTVIWMALDLTILSCYVLLMSHKQVHRWHRWIIFFSSICLLGVALLGLSHTIQEIVTAVNG